jgi:hypothetical protein
MSVLVVADHERAARERQVAIYREEGRELRQVENKWTAVAAGAGGRLRE